MYKYFLVNTVFLILIFLIATPLLRTGRRHILSLCCLLLLLTIPFDNLIIMAGIVEYSPDKILGLRVLEAPIEDFAYALAAALLAPTLWERWSD